MRRTWIQPLILALALPACVSAAELDGRLRTWVGHDADELAQQWGAPTGTYQKKDGTKILTYDKSSIHSSGPGWYSQTYSRHCRIDFETGADNKITHAKWYGAPDECDRSIIPE